MALQDLVQNLQKEAKSEEDKVSEEEIKEAFAAGQVAGMSYVETLEKVAQEAAKEDMGDEYNEYQGQENASPESSSMGTVEKLKKKINQDQSAGKNTNNDAGAGSAENDEDTSKDFPNQPDKNKDESLSKAGAQKIINKLAEKLGDK